MNGFSGFNDCLGSVVQPAVPTVEAPIVDEWYCSSGRYQLWRMLCADMGPQAI